MSPQRGSQHEVAFACGLIGEDASRNGVELRVVADDKVIVTYGIPEGKGHLVQDKRFYAALRKEREKREREKPRTFPRKARATLSPRPMRNCREHLLSAS